MKKIFFLILTCLSFHLFSQQNTIIDGSVIDAVTGEELAFVNIFFQGKNIGTSTDLKGNFHLETLWASNEISISFLGYRTQILKVETGRKNKYTILLVPDAINIDETIIRPKRSRYKKKDNPAVALMQKVIENKNRNRIEAHDYYEYESYEKLEFALDNIKPDLKEKKSLRNFQFMFNYVDTSKLNGKPYLPIFIKETISDRYYRKSPQTSREIIKATKMSGFDRYFDQAGISSYLELLFNNIDIYNNDIEMLNQHFVSPLSNIANGFYKFYLLDTVDIDGIKCSNITFLPHNPADWGFYGNIYITTDSTYAVKKIHLKIMKKINMNFVNDLSLIQEFDRIDDTWVLSKNEINIDFSLFEKNQGIYGKRTVTYKNFIFDKPRQDNDYKGVERKIRLADSDIKSGEFWQQARHEPLNKNEQGIYDMLDTLNNVKQFRNFMDILMIFSTGYIELKKFDFGPVNAMYSYNKVEGNRFRTGGKTSANLHPNIFFETFLAYGTKDKKFKYFESLTYSFKKKKYHQWEYPMNMLTLSYEYNTKILGQELNFSTGDNFLFSFNRGNVDKMVYNNNFKLQYDLETGNGWGFQTSFSHVRQKAAGTLIFENYDADLNLTEIKKLTTSEFNINIRFAPNEQFYQSKHYRATMTKKEPVITFSHTVGIKSLFGSDYGYQQTVISARKRFWISSFGFIDAFARAGKVWGAVPYTLLFIHAANQTYAYHTQSYNMMNFFEFASDKYAEIHLAYNLQGLIFNRIPLLKKTKWREIITFKSVWGGVGDRNLPTNNTKLFRFPVNSKGETTMFTLSQKPYMEGSAGIDNIFRFLRVDLVWRMSYRNNPDVDKLGIRFRFHVNF
ncbi:MAG: DUF5686 and carboxypeptidase regulatory-like domain-containing protein [Prevotellaceae bacterium]|jgi:hypothetical protein|nr:DUF5686 and carboxypeptidase regulatory-like domain-containing protein [Prevotellaceae bacterium]